MEDMAYKFVKGERARVRERNEMHTYMIDVH